MKKVGYLKIGQTKAVNIDFTWLFPSTAEFVNFNALFEFHTLGIIIPTRFDVQPYHMSPFDSNIFSSGLGIMDFIKLLLVTYQAWEVFQYIKSYKTFKFMCQMSVFLQRIKEIAIVLLQGSAFAMKLTDLNIFNVEPSQYLDPQVRSIHINFHLLS